MTAEAGEDKASLQDTEEPRRRSLRRWILTVIAAILVIGAGSIPGIRYWRSWRVPGGWEKGEWSWFAAWKPLRTLEADPETLASVLLAVKGGDMVLLEDGIYPANVTLNCQGAKRAPIVLRAKGEGAVFAPTIKITKAKWLVIDGIAVDGAQALTPSAVYYGVRIWASAHCVLRNCRVKTIRQHPAHAIRADEVHRVIFEGNELSDISRGHALCVYGTSDIIIRDNYIQDNGMSGIQFFGLVSVLAEGNRITRNGGEGGAAINCTSVVDVCIRNNLVYKNLAGGICFHYPPPDAAEEPPAGGTFIGRAIDRILNPLYPQCQGVKVIGNTVYFEPGEGRWSFKLRDECSGFTVYNNVFFGGNHGTVSVAAQSFKDLSMDNNLIATHPGQVLLGETYAADDEPSFGYTVDQWRAKGLDGHSIFEKDPAFRSVRDDDYRLMPGSPAVDAGRAERRRCPRDVEGTRRPQGRTLDCGAYEFVGTAP